MAKIDITKTELVWPGKYNEDGTRREVPRVSLPFQVIETVNESRATREAQKGGVQGTLFDVYEGKEGDTFEAGWRNKLIWGDNLLVMGSLLEKFAGKVDLIYIDPPFATGADFSFSTLIGDGQFEVSKEPSAVEDKAYRDTWGQGLASYLGMLAVRLNLARDLLSPDGSLYLHIGPNISHYVKAVLDEVLGFGNFRSEIIWRRSNSHNKLTGQFGPIHDAILFYSKTDEYHFTPGVRPFSRGYITGRFKYRDKRGIYQPNYLTGPGLRKGESGKPWRGFDPSSKGRHWAIPQASIELLGRDVTGLSTQESLSLLEKADLLYIPKKEGGQPMYKQYLTEGVPYQDLWAYVANSQGCLYGTEECIDEDVKWLEQEEEKTGFDTQKPEGILRRIIETSSQPGDIVLDFFVGSGTTLSVAEKMKRRWIGCDLSRFAIHTSRKRLLSIPKCNPFEVLNLGKYERQYWQGVTFGEKNDKSNTEQALYEYLAFILKLYGAQPVAGMAHLHGKKGKAMVHIGAVDAPVTISEIDGAIDECAKLKQGELHVLGWEWEMGLYDLMVEAAKKKGVKLLLLIIPREVMEQQAAAKGDVRFFELAYLEAEIKQPKKLTAQVVLKDFVISNTELIPEEVRSKVKKWSDFIDYWAVDWDFQNDTFMQGWVAYRTRKERKLPLVCDPHTYEKPGKYRILVKVIDIFGNDTSQAFDVEVK
jgi:adenine-specific DNA-methyltransferase